MRDFKNKGRLKMKKRHNSFKGGNMGYNQKNNEEQNQLKLDKQWIKSGNIKKLIDQVEEQAKKIGGVKPHQIRRIYGPVIKIQEQLKANDSRSQWERELCMLKPRVAYASARETNLKPLKESIFEFIKEIENIEEEVKKKEAVKNFCLFMEAVVAYHKWEQEKK